jgi:hypothetical protein
LIEVGDTHRIELGRKRGLKDDDTVVYEWKVYELREVPESEFTDSNGNGIRDPDETHRWELLDKTFPATDEGKEAALAYAHSL